MSRVGLRNFVLVFYGLLIACAALQPEVSLAGHNLLLFVLAVAAVTPVGSIPWLRDMLRQLEDWPELEPLARSEAGSVLAIEAGVLASSFSGPTGLAGFIVFAFGTTLAWYGGLTFIISAIKIWRCLREARVQSILDRLLALRPVDHVLRRMPWDARFRLRTNTYRIGASFMVVIALVCGAAAVAVATDTHRSNPPLVSAPSVLTKRFHAIEETAIGKGFIRDCPGGPPRLPGADLVNSVPWASEMLFDQWLEPGYGVGADIAGCPGPSIQVKDVTDRVFYELGTRNGVVESVAIASSRHGGCILLDGGAAQLALSQLTSNHVFACAPRGAAGNGDYQLLYTNEGTSMLLRPIVHTPGHRNDSMPYVEIPASAFKLWYGECVTRGMFLWARLDGGSYWNPRRLIISIYPYSDPVAVIVRNSADTYQVAWGADKGTVGIGPPEWISSTTISFLASGARHY